MNFAKRAAELSGTIIAHRRYLHSHAELSFEEHETTAYLVGRLEELGIPVQTFDDYTGCIATIEGGTRGAPWCSGRISTLFPSRRTAAWSLRVFTRA